METQLHPNANKSSNLLRLSALLTMVSYFLFSNRGSFDMTVTLVSIVLLIGSALLVRKGNIWIRWVLLAMLFISWAATAIALPTLIKSKLTPATYFSFMQDVLQAIAVIMLFVPYKIPQEQLEEEEEISAD